MDFQFGLFVLLLALAFANGTNDVSKAIATLVGSGITNYRTAIVWGTVWTVLGASVSGLVASAMVKTFRSGLIAPGTATPPALALAVLTGSMIWVLIASRTGLPVSTTHALMGARRCRAGRVRGGRTHLVSHRQENCTPSVAEPAMPDHRSTQNPVMDS